MIRYHSTHHSAPPATFEEALLSGLAPDGGLYHPDAIPPFTADDLRAMAGARDDPAPQALLHEVAFRLLHRWLESELDAHTLRAIVAGALDFPLPLRPVGPFHILELFHGPTLAFKDVAARFLARLMAHFLAQRGQQATLLVATSGDTGGAVAHGFGGQPNLRVVVLFPKGRVSRLQEEQLTRVAANILPVEVEGDFDDCQALVKRAFVAPSLAGRNLSSANSINVARLLPQAIPYAFAFWASGQADLEFVVPSGNFGNLTGGLFARAMGLPLAAFIAATNANDAVARFYQSGRYEPRATVATLSNAMDVGRPSNFARLVALLGEEPRRFRAGLRAFRVSDEATVATIRRVWQEHGYALCPHSAVGWAVAEQHADPALQPVLVATASPTKFAAELRAATGIEVDDGAALAALRERPARKQTIPNQWASLERLLLALE